MCESGTICFELLKCAPTALVSLAIGAVAGLIAREQWLVARAKLNLDLFEQRYALYELLCNCLQMIISKPNTEALGDLFKSTDKFYFLFGAEIGDFIVDVREKLIERD